MDDVSRIVAHRPDFERYREPLGVPCGPESCITVLVGRTVAGAVPTHQEWADLPAGLRDGVVRQGTCVECGSEPSPPGFNRSECWGCRARGEVSGGSSRTARTTPSRKCPAALAASWHPTRNSRKTPADFTYGSHYEAWCQCPKVKGHVWRPRISSRTSQVAGCMWSFCPIFRSSHSSGDRSVHNGVGWNWALEVR